MNNLELVILYDLNLHTDTKGENKVGRAHLASLLNCTTVTAQKRVQKLIDGGYIHQIKFPTIGRGHGYRYEYYISSDGKDALFNNWQSAYALYRRHIADRIKETLEKINKGFVSRSKKSKRSDKQLPLFGDE